MVKKEYKSIVAIDEIYYLLTEIYPNRTISISVEVNGYVVHGIRRKPKIEINIWIGDEWEEDKKIKSSELKKFEIYEEAISYVDNLRAMKSKLN